MPKVSLPLAFSFLASLALATVPAQAEVLGYTGYQSTITELLLTESGDFIPTGRSWTPAGIFDIHAIERDAAGLIYFTTVTSTGFQDLWVMDPETGVATVLEQVGTPGHADLAFDDAGVLWISSSAGDLFTYDPSNGAFALVGSITSATPPQGIAWLGGRLYVVLEPADPDSGPVLGVVEPSTGAVSEAFELTGLSGEPAFFRQIESLDFDDAGGLWLGFIDWTAVIDPPFALAGAGYLANPFLDGEPSERYVSGSFRAGMPLAVTGSLTVVEVPAMGRLGILILAALLTTLAIYQLRWRARS